MKEWQRLSTHPADNEVQRAKAQLKASLLLGLDGTTATAEDLGRQLVTTGKRSTPKEIEEAIEKVSVSDIQRVAKKCAFLFSSPFSSLNVRSPFTSRSSHFTSLLHSLRLLLRLLSDTLPSHRNRNIAVVPNVSSSLT
jgi:hypothetical protein